MNAQEKAELTAVLREARLLLRLPSNDFSWSSWENADQATAEIDSYLHQIEANDFSSALDMAVLFTIAGPIQEVSLSSGWSDSFIRLANRFDDAIEPIRKH